MTDIPISGLLDGESLRTRQAEAIFEQDGVTFKGPTRPNPPQQINVVNQNQLVDEIGVGLDFVIPDNTSLTIVIDDSIELIRPFKLGLNSVLHISASTAANVITWVNEDVSMFQNLDPLNAISELKLDNLHIIGTEENDIFDIIGNDQSSVVCSNVIFQDLDSVGSIDTGAFDFTACSMRNINIGLSFKNQRSGRIDRFSISQPNSVTLTAITLVAGVNPMNVTIDTLKAVALGVGNTLLFIEPNPPAGSTFNITNSDSDLGDFYALGNNITINSVSDGQFGHIRLQGVHNVTVGDIVRLSGFLVHPTYNGVFTVTDVPTGSEFEVLENFLGTDTGILNAVSMDSTDVEVLARDNVNQQDSMFIGGWFHSTNAASTTILNGTFSPLNLSTSGGVTAFVENERFSIDNADNGVIQYIGLIAKTVTLIGILGLMKTGSDRDYNLRYVIDRGEIDTVAVVLGGTGYVDAESVTLSGQTSGATNATATISVTAGAITAINIVDGSSQYVEGETLDVIGGSGSGATGTATLIGFVSLPTIIERLQTISTTTRDTVLNQEVVLNTGDKIRIEIEGDGTADLVDVVFGSLDMKG